MNIRYTFLIAGISGALAVGLGAFGAHGLEEFLAANDRTDTFETAVRYHFYHSLLLIVLAILRELYPGMPHIKTATHCCLLGILIFSGSLYALCFSSATWFGPITPIGGIFLLAAWLLTGVGAWKFHNK